MKHLISLILTSMLLINTNASAFESAKTLPKGVRNIDIRTVNTDIESKTNNASDPRPLAEPLSKDLTFGQIANGEKPLKSKQLKAFLLSSGFDEDQSVGTFQADLKGHIKVTAPIFAYGITDNFTAAIAVPYYRAATSIDVGFQPNETGQAFLNALSDPENNQTAAARSAGLKLNSAVDSLNTKLEDNGFSTLDDWEESGLGDITLATKYKITSNHLGGIATSNGLVLPTGRVDDVDILNDIAFGDGQPDVFSQIVFERNLPYNLNLAQSGKYTVQLPSSKTVRLVEEDEVIEVDKSEAKFKLGDKIDTGTSMTYTPDFGLTTGIGYNYFKKFGDTYREIPVETKEILETNTVQEAHVAEMAIGYTTLPAFKRGEFIAPLEMKFTYLKQLKSKNMPVTDMAQFDVNLFF